MYFSIRSLKLVAVALAITMAAACADAPTEAGSFDGPFEGRWNGRDWNGRGFAVLMQDTLYLIGHQDIYDQGHYEQQVRVQVRYDGAGRYQLDGTPARQARMAEIVGGDAGYFPGATGDMTLRELESGTWLEGTIHLAATGPNGPWGFEDGEFRVRVYDSFQKVPGW